MPNKSTRKRKFASCNFDLFYFFDYICYYKIMIKKSTYAAIVLSGTAVLLAVVLVIVWFATQRSIDDFLPIKIVDLPQQNMTTVDSGGYLGQPDMVRTRSGKFITIYPQGHGYGSLIMQTSQDGKTWVNSSTPSSWANSQEVPTLYTLDFVDCTQWLILISGKPYWTAAGLRADGFQYSISRDDGVTWSEFKTVHSPMDCIVAMSSLTQLKSDGEFVDKWLGTFHTHEFVNYGTVLSFDAQGNAIWSTPKPLLDEYRSIERANKLCEIEIIRAPDDTLVMLTRNEARGGHTSMISISQDEGQTWSEPKYLPSYLSGDRFQAAIDDSTGKLLLSFRQIVPYGQNALSLDKFMTKGWVLWVGNLADLIDYANGQFTGDILGEKLILLGADSSGDCGYSGVVASNGTVTAVSYGYFDTSGNPIIRAVNFEYMDIS